MYLPSGDQPRGTPFTSASTVSSDDPSAPFTYILFALKYTTRLPSGDHTGPRSDSGVLVRRNELLRARSMTQTSRTPNESASNANRRPSLDNERLSGETSSGTSLMCSPARLNQASFTNAKSPPV